MSDWNRLFIDAINEYLNIKTEVKTSGEFTLLEGKTERLIGICKQLNASEYVSGPAARDYMDEALFADAGITLSWADYSAYPSYSQLNGEFEHSVTILDLLFNHGPEAPNFMKHCR